MRISVRMGMLAGAASISIASAEAQVTAPPEPAQQADQESVGDIIVTAQRRSERQSQVPISITAYNAKSLAATGVVEARALSQVTPGLNFQSVGSAAQPLIRGIGSSGSSVGDSSNVAMYIDGVYQPFQAGNFLRFNDIERIEVLKGPQGTLFGRNAAGGAISITTQGPKLGDVTGKLSASYARYDEVQLNGFISVPLGDKAAFSLSGNYIHSDGYRRDIFMDRQLGYVRGGGTRAKLLVEPTESTTILVSGYYNRVNDITTFGNQALDGNASIRVTVPGILLATEPNTSSLNVVPVNRVRSWGGSLKVDQDVGFATLTSLTAFSKTRQFAVTDSDLSPAASSQSRIRFGDDMISQDLTLASSAGGPLKWLVGGTYYREKGFFFNRTFGGLTVPAADPPLTSGQDVERIRIEAVAVFAELEYRITDRLTLIAGGRYSHDEPGFSGARIFPATGLENPATRVAGADSFSKFTPRVSLRYAVTPTLNAYATYSKGFKSGVFNANQLQADAVEPENVSAYEIGMKGALSRSFSFDLAGYYYDYQGLQIASFGTTATNVILRNAAQAEIYGLEANGNLSPVTGLNLRAGAAYTHGEYTDFPGAQGFRRTTNAAGTPIGGNTSFSFDASGQRLIRTPRLQANGTISYETDLGNGSTIGGNATVSHTSRMNHDVSGNFVQPAFTLVNANLSWTSADDHIRATLFGTNIFDEDYIAGVLVSGIATAVTYAQPRSYGVRLEYLF
ncbi:iron complex outermembrane receptor protein [Sphingomonas zeicaulis]|uniref:TonB-dependent receptor n=1 Tax=Sphingomonas zeicaulis TaxID=1632740 RepID=UPI003D208244